MKNRRAQSIVIFCHCLLFCLISAGINAEEEGTLFDSEATVSLEFHNAELNSILKIFSIQTGINFIAAEDVENKMVTLYLNNVPIKDALDKLCKANSLSYEIYPEANIFIIKSAVKPELETITRVYPIKYRGLPNANLLKEKDKLLETTTTADIVNSIRQVLSSNGRISEDIATNSLIITDIPNKFPEIEKLIASLDVPQSQVMLEVEILDVNKNVVDNLGFNFGDNPLTLILPSGYNQIGNTFYIGAQANRRREGGVTFGQTYANLLYFLRTQTDTKYLARPRLLTLNNETAEISVTRDEVVGRRTTVNTTSSGTTTTTEFIRSTDLALTTEGTGVFLRVTPHINFETNEVSMVINPKSSVTNTSTIASTEADAEVRETKSFVKVRDAETIVLGGLIHNDSVVTVTKLPILGDIPLLGAFFRRKNQTKNIERELLVFITPHIIKEKNLDFAKAQKIGLAEREQSPPVTRGRQAAINASLNKFENIK